MNINGAMGLPRRLARNSRTLGTTVGCGGTAGQNHNTTVKEAKQEQEWKNQEREQTREEESL